MTAPIMSHSVDYRFHHYHTAQYCRDQLKLLETPPLAHDIATIIKHQAYASSAVLASVAFLEAAINSFGLVPLDKFTATGQLPENPRERFAFLKDFTRDLRLLEKYQFALTIIGLAPFGTGIEPYQSTYLLIRLRNALVHYTPEWAHELDDHDKLEKQLRPKFKINPLVDDIHDLFFPRACLGLGCAEWSISVASRFLETFYTQVGTPSLMHELEIIQ
jgi:hypothetical protein